MVIRRDTDVARLFWLRFARYTINRPEIARGAAECGIPHLTVDATADVTTSEVCQAAQAAAHRLAELASRQGSRP